MAWFDKIFGFRGRKLEKKENPAARYHVQGIMQPQWSGVSYAALAKEGYQKNPIVFSCLSMISNACSNLIMNFFIVDADGKKQEIFEHPVKNLIMNPSSSQGSIAFLRDLHSQLGISGNAYILFVKIPSSPHPLEMYILRSDRVEILPDARGYPARYRYNGNGTYSYYEAKDVLHIKFFHPLNDWYGYSPIQAAAKSIDVHNSCNDYNKALLDNSARPSGALKYKPEPDASQNLTDEQYNRLKNQFEEQYTGSANAGKPLILEGGLDWLPMSFNQKDMQFIENKDQAAREIAICMGIPPMMLGIKGDSTYSNFSEANRAFYRQTVIPTANFALKEFERYFKQQFPDLFIEIDEDKISALADERTELWDRVGKAEYISANEKRSLTGYAEYTETENIADTILIDGGKVPIDQAGFTAGGAEPKT